MAYTCGNSIYVSLHVSGAYTTIHIRQHMDNTDVATGTTQINRDGLFLTTDEFSSLLYQLNAIEKSFTQGQNDEKNLSSVCSALTKRKRDDNDNDESEPARQKCRVSKVDDSIKKWYAIKIKAIIQKKLKDDCFSCLMQLSDNHMCQTNINDVSHNYLETFFTTVLEGVDIKLIIADLNLSNSKSRSIPAMVKRNSWQQAVKSIIQSDID